MVISGSLAIFVFVSLHLVVLEALQVILKWHITSQPPHLLAQYSWKKSSTKALDVAQASSVQGQFFHIMMFALNRKCFFR